MKYLLFVIVLFLPSKIKIVIYRLLGASIGKNCYIGFSIVNAQNLEIGDCVYIGHLNLLWRLKKLQLGGGSRINFLNWITGANTGCFNLGRNSSISVLHFFEGSANIFIGDNTIVAGRSSQFFTHGITPGNLDDKKEIKIGGWCYIGSAARFVPGSGVGNCTFVGMGSIITKSHNADHVLLAGVPAMQKRNIPIDSMYFRRPFLPHAHHPKDYNG